MLAKEIADHWVHSPPAMTNGRAANADAQGSSASSDSSDESTEAMEEESRGHVVEEAMHQDVAGSDDDANAQTQDFEAQPFRALPFGPSEPAQAQASRDGK